jgi:hypothetical protein
MRQGCGFGALIHDLSCEPHQATVSGRRSRNRETNQADNSDGHLALDKEGARLCMLSPAKCGSLDEAATLVGPSLARNESLPQAIQSQPHPIIHLSIVVQVQ